MARSFEMDMTKGSILKKLIICCVPIILTNIIQNLFHSADVLVLGMFTNDNAVAAVGTNTSIIALVVALFNGLSSGANVITARYIGMGDGERVKKAVGLSVIISLVSGGLILVLGVTMARTFHILMNCQPEYIDMATTYLTVYCLGMPIMMLYNFSSSIMRAAGDTLRPLLFLIFGGVLNVGGNIFFIKVLGMDVEGVAISTIISQGVSAVMCIVVLLKNKGICKLELKYIRFYKQEFKEIMIIGLPAGLQSLSFSATNVVITSTVNKLNAMAAYTLAGQFDSLIYNTGYGTALGTMSFVSQNLGAGDIKRVKKTIFTSIGFCTVACLTIGTLIYLLSDILLHIGTNSAIVVEEAKRRLVITCFTYWTCGIMDILSYSLRSLGKSVSAFVVTFFIVCMFRIGWIYSLIDVWPSMTMVYLCWPISWVLNSTVQGIVLGARVKKLEQKKRDLTFAEDVKEDKQTA